MRNSLQFDMGGQAITISEMTAVEAAMFIPLGMKLADCANKPVAELGVIISENTQTIIEILARCTNVGDEMRNWGAGAVLAILPKFFEVNSSFFAQLRGLVMPKPTP